MRSIEGELPTGLAEAEELDSSRFQPPTPVPPNRDGCRTSMVIRAKGSHLAAAARANIELLNKSVTISAARIDGTTRAIYRGSLEQSVCSHLGEFDYLDISGKVIALGGKPRQLSVTIGRKTYLDTDRGRFWLADSESGSDEPELSLWDARERPSKLLSTVERVLNAPLDVAAAVHTPRETLVVGTLTLDSRVLSLFELDLTRRRVLHQVNTGLTCEYHSCRAGLAGFELENGLLLFVAKVFGESCGAKCTTMASGELWTLTGDGFHSARALPESMITPAGLDYSSTVTRTKLYWIDGDAAPPLEILVESEESGEGEEKTSRFILGYVAQDQSYTKREGLLDLSPEQLAPFHGGEFAMY